MPEFPPEAPPAFKVGEKHAQLKGTWVTGANGHGLQGLVSHKGHVIVVAGDPVKADTDYPNAGYRQKAACLDCRHEFTPLVDGEFLQTPVDDEYLQNALDRLDMVIANAKRARRKIAKEMTT